jgi:hypothetical protein
MELNFSGTLVGLATLLIIWFGRYACIKGEYYFSKKIWVVFLLVGIGAVGCAFFVPVLEWSSILSIFGFTFLWGIQEVIEQEKRVEKGWYPKRKGKD